MSKFPKYKKEKGGLMSRLPMRQCLVPSRKCKVQNCKICNTKNTNIKKYISKVQKGGLMSWLPMRPCLVSSRKYKLQNCKICETKNTDIKKYIYVQNIKISKEQKGGLMSWLPMRPWLVSSRKYTTTVDTLLLTTSIQCGYTTHTVHWYRYKGFKVDRTIHNHTDVYQI